VHGNIAAISSIIGRIPPLVRGGLFDHRVCGGVVDADQGLEMDPVSSVGGSIVGWGIGRGLAVFALNA
jgi:hypothetical protein